MGDDHLDSFPGTPAFHTTRWSEVRAAGSGSAAARAALESLCRAYGYPLYAFLRRDGHGADDARDLVQGFLASLIARDDLARVAPEGGRFRSWLLAGLRHFASNERARERAQKRGGGVPPLSLDALVGAAEERYAVEPADGETPERLYERRFALAVLEAALDRLGAAEEAAGRGAAFDALRPFLTGDPPPDGLAGAAEALGKRAGAVKVAAHRLRKRFRAALVEEVTRQVERPQDVEDELLHLFRVLGA